MFDDVMYFFFFFFCVLETFEIHVNLFVSAIRFVCLFMEYAGRGSSIGSVFAWHASGPTSGTLFLGVLVMKRFYGHSPSFAVSRRTVVSY